MKRFAATLACLLLLASSVFAPRHAAQEEVDRSLAEEIFKIRAIDHHAHPLRFRWVAFDAALMLPLSSAAVREVNPDYAAFYPGEDSLLKRYLSDLKMSSVPATLGEFTARVVTPTLEAQKRAGAVGVKFEAAYLRGLDFADAGEPEAARVYARYARGGAPNAAEYN